MSYSRAGRGYTKPRPGSRVNWGHSVALKLEGAWLFNEASGLSINDSSNKYISALGVSLGWKAIAGFPDSGADFDGSGSYAQVPSRTILFPASIFVKTSFNSAVGTYTFIGHTNDASTGYRLTLIGGVPAFTLSGVANYSFTSFPAVVVGRMYSFLVSIEGDAATGYWKDHTTGLTYTQTLTIGTMLGTTLGFIDFGRRIGVTPTYLAGQIVHAFLWSRVLASRDFDSLVTEPYAMIQPVTYRRRFVSAAGVTMDTWFTQHAPHRAKPEIVMHA